MQGKLVFFFVPLSLLNPPNMNKTPKYYTVWKGHKTGVFSTWAECQAQIDNFQGALYKSFPTAKAAWEALAQEPHQFFKKQNAHSPASQSQEIIWQSLSVDAACSGNPGDMEYRGVHTLTQEVIFHKGPFAQGTNNIGEFLAIVHGLALLKQQGQHEVPIYTDSQTAMAWVRNKKVKTQLELTAENVELFQLITRAERWLSTNDYQNPIIKWDTKKWGEIPADFGRK